MYWKTTNLHLNNGYTIPDCRDSVPFFRKICMNILDL